jgi:hypothetical protein
MAIYKIFDSLKVNLKLCKYSGKKNTEFSVFFLPEYLLELAKTRTDTPLFPGQ